MRIDGGCHCGAITYEAEIDPDKVFLCHCTDCQTLTGSAFRIVVRVPAADYKLLSGAPKVYVKTSEAGTKRAQAFCPDCGTPIYAAAAEDGPKVYGIRLGTARQRDQLRPRTQWWTRSAQGWLADLDSVPKMEKQ